MLSLWGDLAGPVAATGNVNEVGWQEAPVAFLVLSRDPWF